MAFSELQSNRQIGMELGTIPWVAINEYAIRHNINGQEFDELIYYISKLDYHYLSSIQEKNK